MTRFCLMLLPLFTWLMPAVSQNIVSKQDVIKELQTLRNAISATKSADIYFTKNQNSCRTIINDAIINIDSRYDGFPGRYLESLKSLTGVANDLSKAGATD